MRHTVFMLIGALVISGSAYAQKMKVGEYYDVYIDSRGESDVQGVSTARGQQWTIKHDGATYIGVHFAQFKLAPGDFLVVSDAEGNQSYTLRGKGKMDSGRFWSQHVKGPAMVVELVAKSDQSRFVIDQYAAGFVDLGPSIEAVCGENDLENAVCYQGWPEYERGKAVARLLIKSMWLCTGWLASPNNHLVTNEHCISSAYDALNTDYEFMAEAPNCSDHNCQLCYPGKVLSGATFIQANPNFDYCLVQITTGNPATTHGYLQIDDRDAIEGEEAYIPQHPAGRAKEYGIYCEGSPCQINSITQPACTGTGYYDVGYWIDTEGGSSGSPVLATSSHQVIALHHCHQYCEGPNLGVPIDLICAEICQYLGYCGDGACDAAEDPCNCPEDCGTPPQSETGLCADGKDNDCDNQVDCDDADCVGDPACICDNDGECETGEDCDNCPGDCISGEGADCGDGTCQPVAGEDCLSCPEDCNGKQVGAAKRQFCCGGDSTSTNPVGCDDERCTAEGWMCSNDLSEPYCCGDGECEGAENYVNCRIDCPESYYCGDGECDAGEDQCNCEADCGPPPSNETDCTDGLDNDCDGKTDYADDDCCLSKGEPCMSNNECCSGSCHPVKLTCK